MRASVHAPYRRGVGKLGGSGGGLLGTTLSWMRRRFPERQVLVRAEGRVSYITLSHRLQLTMAALGLAGIGAIAYALTGGLHSAPDTQAVEQLAIAAAAQTAQLQAEIDELQKKLAAANEQAAAGAQSGAGNDAAMADLQARIATLEGARDHAIAEQHQLEVQLELAREAASAKSANLAQLSHALDANRGELLRMRQLESELETANTRAGQYKVDLATN